MSNKAKKNPGPVLVRLDELEESEEEYPAEIRRIMEQNLLNIGFGNGVVAERILAIVSPNSSPMKRLKDEAKEENRLIDATQGRRTRSIIITDSNHVILSAIQTETISQRFAALQTKEEKE
jgi:extracellular matrix regulatory protein A